MKNRHPLIYRNISLLLAVFLLLSMLLAGCMPSQPSATEDSTITTEVGAIQPGTQPTDPPSTTLQTDAESQETDPTLPPQTDPIQNPTDPTVPPTTNRPTEPEATDAPVDHPTEPDTTVSPETEGNTSHSFQIHFLDVGQADAALVLCGAHAMLIDGGNAADSNLIYSHLKNTGITHLDYIVATHAHEDHVGGLAGALNYATVGTVYCPVRSYNTKAFNNFDKYVQQRGVSITVPKAGDSFSLGSAKVQIIACDPSAEDPNNSSIILRITYGSTSFLFTGDAEREAEQAALSSGFTLKSDVLKVGHHGSNSSTTYPFLREVMPTYAVISVGNGNTYGHPTEAVLSRLRDADAKVYRTDMQGTVVATSNGKTVTMRVTRNPNVETLGPAAPQPTEPPKTTEPTTGDTPETTEGLGVTYVINKRSLLFHDPDCEAVSNMSDKNKLLSTQTREELLSQGYTPCGWCNP